jgi:hypothetical protein
MQHKITGVFIAICMSKERSQSFRGELQSLCGMIIHEMYREYFSVADILC